MIRLVCHFLLGLGCAGCAEPGASCSYERDTVALDEPVVGFSAADEQRAIVGTWIGDLVYHGGGAP